MYELKEAASGEGESILYDEKYFYRGLDVEHATFLLTMLATLKPSIKEKLAKTSLFQGKRSFSENTPQTVLIHEKITFISYPHEWCALMLKEAALFHLQLQIELLNHNLYLKDAHPWNILFENGKFVFVDIPSVVDSKRLIELGSVQLKEECSTLWQFFYQIMHNMFMPYFFLPLCGYAYGKREWIKSRIESTTLNAATDTINYRNCFPQRKLSFKNILDSFKLMSKLFKFHKILGKKTDISYALKEIYALVATIPVKKENSDYKSYYIQKNELSDYTVNDAWNQKQKSIYQILLNTEISSVLDIACNTGWYSILSAKQGKKVVALDVDEACIEDLYMQVRQFGYDILPLHCSIKDLTKRKYSILTGKPVLISFEDRMRCDAVLALGILHHLILGEGISFDEIFKLFKQFTKHQLIIEFIEKEDDKIKDQPDFFSAYYHNSLKYEFYNLQCFLDISKKYFKSYKIYHSFPETRKIIVFDNVD